MCAMYKLFKGGQYEAALERREGINKAVQDDVSHIFKGYRFIFHIFKYVVFNSYNFEPELIKGSKFHEYFQRNKFLRKT